MQNALFFFTTCVYALLEIKFIIKICRIYSLIKLRFKDKEK